MALDPNDLILFARVAELGSFTLAAERTGLPKSTVSRRISILEEELGERLLLRTTRKLSLTEIGMHMLDHARQLIAELESADEFARNRQTAATGRLRVSMPADLAAGMFAPLLSNFVLQHPLICLELDLTPRQVDLIGEGFDLAIRMSDSLEDTSLGARRLADFTASLYASPDYLSRKGTPVLPAELLDHQGLCLLSRSGKPAPWRLENAGAVWQGHPPPRAVINSPAALLNMAIAGAGIALLDDHIAHPALRDGRLVSVLDQWRMPQATAWAVFPGRRLMPRRTRVFLDAIDSHIAGSSCRAVAQSVRDARATRRPAVAA